MSSSISAMNASSSTTSTRDRLPEFIETDFLRVGNANAALHAIRVEREIDTASQFVRQSAFDEARTEAAARRWRHFGAAALAPDQIEKRCLHSGRVRLDRPCHLHGSALDRERTIFRRVGRELVKGHAQND